MSEQKPMTDEQLQQWIEACNHGPARQVLRQYLTQASAISSLMEENERLKANVDALEHQWSMERDLKLEYVEAMKAAQQRVKNAVKVLEPFAYEANSIEQNYLRPLSDQFTGAYNSMPLGVYRAARRFIKEAGE
jgi:dynactin complex subunit